MFFSVVIPTYNRLPILKKCLQALERQQFTNPAVTGYEVVVVDDGSTDETLAWLESRRERIPEQARLRKRIPEHERSSSASRSSRALAGAERRACGEESREQFPHVRSLCQDHQGPAAARNLGVESAQGDTIVFIDSDLVVTENFLQSHADALLRGQEKYGSDRLFTYGRVVNTCNFEDPTSERYKITDFSAAYFATGNVAIARKWLLEAGLFDPRFQLYGWEDLELGVRLNKMGLKLIKCPAAVGYHWHPPFALDQIPGMIDREIQRGRMGVLFYTKHPTWEVRMMIQMTWLHLFLWGMLSLGGRLNERSIAPGLQWAIDRGKSQLALEVARIFLNWYNVKAVYAAYNEMKSSR